MIKRTGPMSIGHKAVAHGGIIHVGGLIASDLAKDMKGQTAEICAKIDAVLEEQGADKSKLLSATIYVTDLSKRPQMNEAWSDWLEPANLPARATIGVADLGPGVLIEITATAAA